MDFVGSGERLRVCVNIDMTTYEQSLTRDRLSRKLRVCSLLDTLLIRSCYQISIRIQIDKFLIGSFGYQSTIDKMTLLSMNYL